MKIESEKSWLKINKLKNPDELKLETVLIVNCFTEQFVANWKTTTVIVYVSIVLYIIV